MDRPNHPGREAARRSPVDRAALESDLRRRVDGEVRFDDGSRALYATDASNYRFTPLGVVLPKTPEAVVEALAACRAHGAPVTPRGDGTALAGQTCNASVIIDFTKYMNRILEIDPDRKIARVQPGVILDHLRRSAERHHLTFGPDPATHRHNTLGGMIGNNSCGVHSVMAGKTVDNTESLDVVTYDGLRMTVGPTPDEELDRIVAEGGRRGQIYATMKEIRDRCADLIRKRYPKIPRRVSGYNFDQLLPENGFHVARALVGTEGTCVTVLEATLRLVHSPPGRALLVLGYSDVYHAADHIMEILGFGPVGLEGLDDLLVDYMKKKGLHPQDAKLLPDGAGWLLAEFGADTLDQARDKARSVMDALKKVNSPPSMKLYTDKAEEDLVWQVRESGLGATANVPGLPLMWDGWEDSAVPPEKLGGYLRDFRSLLDRFGYQCSLYGHFGQGCVHCRISFDYFTRDGIRTYMAFIENAADLVVRYGGSLSGEHGDGQSRAMLLPKMFGPELVDAFRDFKRAWDPEGKMNPGKVVDAHRPDQDLRIGDHYNPWHPATHFTFRDDEESFPRATIRCVGVGQCRRFDDNVFMCPSFLVSKEERHTTRGRAHSLFEMFEGRLLDQTWRNKEVQEALELCLACKGCKKECPVNVDIAMYKSEFHSHYYRHRLRPRHAYTMGLIGWLGPLGSRFPRLANAVAQGRLTRGAAKALAGIDAERSFPTFARRSFARWARGRKPAHPDGPPAFLFVDVFNDVFYPMTVRSALAVLERFGFRVLLPERRLPSVRPLLHYGMLNWARRELEKVVAALSPVVRRDIPVVFLEPSTAAVYRDELPALWPQDEDGRRLTKNAYLFGEFLRARDLRPPKVGGRIIYHAHCHEKAVLDPDATRDLFKRMDVSFDEPQATCCGMAGSFGFESGHYEVSQKVANLYLFPAIRSAPPETPIVCEGFSCRTQIHQGTGRAPLHLAEFVWKAMEASPRPETG